MSGSQYVISGQQITIPIGSGSPPADWEVGSKVSINTPNVPFTVVDGGWNGNPLNAVFYRDIVSGEFSKLSLGVGSLINISGASANNGYYKVISYTAGIDPALDQMTLDVWDTRVINGVSTTGWFAASAIQTGSFTGDIQKEGTLYEIDSLITETVDTDEVLIGFSFTRLLHDGIDTVSMLAAMSVFLPDAENPVQYQEDTGLFAALHGYQSVCDSTCA